MLLSAYENGEKSKSLLGQMHLRKSMKFISTAVPYSKNNLLTQQCLVSMKVDNNGGSFLPHFDTIKSKDLSCRDWLNEIVIADASRNTYSRLDIIKLLANKDGGAHIDSSLDDRNEQLKAPNISNWIFVEADGAEKILNGNVVYCTMRQMTFEILQSLYRVKRCSFDEVYF